MTIESLWYASYVDGRAPKVRLVRPEVLRDPDAPRRLAVAFGAGDGYGYAGYRPVRSRWRPHHQIWLWRDSGMPGEWFSIPDWFVARMRTIRGTVQAWCLDRGHGRTTTSELITALEDRMLVERIMRGRR